MFFITQHLNNSIAWPRNLSKFVVCCHVLSSLLFKCLCDLPLCHEQVFRDWSLEKESKISLIQTGRVTLFDRFPNAEFGLELSYSPKNADGNTSSPNSYKKRQCSCVHNSNSRCDLYGPKLILSVFCCYHSVALTCNDELLVNVLVIQQVDVVVTIRLSWQICTHWIIPWLRYHKFVFLEWLKERKRKY